jgi:hypothetical protein
MNADMVAVHDLKKDIGSAVEPLHKSKKLQFG